MDNDTRADHDAHERDASEDAADLTPGERLLLATIREIVKAPHGPRPIAIDRLAAIMGIDTLGARTYLRSLKARGLVVVVGRKGQREVLDVAPKIAAGSS